MKYKSTRGGESGLSASQVILQGIAKDGGLFVPEEIPHIDKSLEGLSALSYQALAYEILKCYLTDYEEEELKSCIAGAYDDKFTAPEITPVVKTGEDLFFLELFHGKTLAFKDVALSLLPHLLKAAARKNNIQKEIMILTATSGDTGKAALEAFRDVEDTRITVFYPENGVSALQKMQMVTQEGENTSVAGIKGNFDDAQTAVKKIFLDADVKKELDEKGIMLSSANSINIGRLLPQIVYYFYAYFCMVKAGEIKMDETVNFVVPTGNFGNILAGHYAKKMGLPVNKLVCASNENNVLFDFFRRSVYDANRDFKQTTAPSIDILISSNLERLLYDIQRDPEKVRNMMEALQEKGRYNFGSEAEGFAGYFSDEKEGADAIRKVYDKYEYIMDTHTAIAYCAYEKFMQENKADAAKKTVILSTASPYKFTKAVMSAIDNKYADEQWDDFMLIEAMADYLHEGVPAQIAGIQDKEIRHRSVLEKDAVRDMILKGYR